MTRGRFFFYYFGRIPISTNILSIERTNNVRNHGSVFSPQPPFLYFRVHVKTKNDANDFGSRWTKGRRKSRKKGTHGFELSRQLVRKTARRSYVSIVQHEKKCEKRNQTTLVGSCLSAILHIAALARGGSTLEINAPHDIPPVVWSHSSPCATRSSRSFEYPDAFAPVVSPRDDIDCSRPIFWVLWRLPEVRLALLHSH